MSNRRKNKQNTNDLGGSHPQEFKAEHRHFLARSLERNDVDLAALLQLNARLKSTKQKIVESCGEIVLLDLGCGRLTLFNDELYEEKKSEDDETRVLTPVQKDLCVNFLLLMKLRRKLANRLVRRLNRAAQAMDGNDVSPPSAPRYGDLRLHIDSQALQDRVHFWKRYDDAKKQLKENQQGSEKKDIETTVSEKVKEKARADEVKPEEAASTPVEPKSKEGFSGGNDGLEKKPEKDENDSMDVDTPISSSAANKPVSSDSWENEKPKETLEVPKDDPLDTLREYEEAYDKVWDKDSKQFKYVLASTEHAEDYKLIKGGVAIGAATRLLSEHEREQEFKRWQTTILSRIPRQPTFEELGLKNHVFCLEQRRKRCLEVATEHDNDDEESPKKPKVEENGDGHDESKQHNDDDTEQEEDVLEKTEGDAMDEEEEDDDDIDDAEKKADHGSNDVKSDAAEEKGAQEKAESQMPEQKKITLQPRKKKEQEGEEKQEENQEEPKRIKPLSLAAVPSFYEQDMLRIRNVHADLVGSSILEEAKHTMAHATSEYNAALRMSNQIHDARTRLQHNYTYFMQQKRTQIAKHENDYRVQFAIEKQKWLKEKIQHDQQRAKQFLPSTWGSTPYGTNYTQNYQGRGGLASVVGSCMADVVDGVVLMTERNVTGSRYPDFKSPLNPSGDSAQQLTLQENELKRQLNDLNVKFQTSEERRKSAWIKMMKTKVETDASGGRRGYVDLSSIHRIPVPPLRNSTPQGVPRDFGMRLAIATFTPPPLNQVKTNDLKYSASRICAKISEHVKVAPVSEPKRDKDGLYVRPGPKRKEMDWDAFRGIWVPAVKGFDDSQQE